MSLGGANLTETTLIRNGIVITMDKKRRYFEDGAIVIEDDKIVDVGKTDAISNKYKADRIIDAKKKAVMPGLINTHIHSDLIRGTADDLPLVPWLDNFVWPWHKILTPDIAYVTSLLTYSESLKSGTTCLLDMFRFMHRCADAAKEVGIRAVLSPMAADSPEYNYLESFGDNEKLVKERNGFAGGRVRIWFGMEWPYMSSDEFMRKIVEGSKKYKVGIHTHSSEIKDEWEMAMNRFGKHSIEAFDDKGLLGKNTVIAHCCWLTDKERRLLGTTKTNVAHCSISNQKLADGVAPVPELIKYGANVSLGTDGLKENNTADMFEVMKFASLLHKVTRLEATVLPAMQTLEMATIKGAQSLGLEKEIGSIEPGKRADIILVNLHKLRLTPVLFGEYFNVISHLVYAAHGDDVETVIVDGKTVMEDRVLKNIDEDKLIKTATETTERVMETRKQFLLKA